MIPHELSKSDIVKIIEQLDVLLPSTPLTNKAEVEKGLLRQGQLEILHLIEAMQHFVLIQNWVATTAAVHDSTTAKAGIDSGNSRPPNGLLCFLL